MLLRITNADPIMPFDDVYASELIAGMNPSTDAFTARADSTLVIQAVAPTNQVSETVSAGYTLVDKIDNGIGDEQLLVVSKDDLVNNAGAIDGTIGMTFAANETASVLNIAIAAHRGRTDAGPVLESQTDVNSSASSGGLAITKPTGTSSGDLLLLMITSEDNYTVTAPAGWTELHDETVGANDQAYIAYKVAGGSEPASYTFSPSTTSDLWLGSMLRISNVHQTNPIDTSATITSNGSLNFPVQP